MKKIIILFLVFTTSIMLFSQEYKTYELESVKSIMKDNSFVPLMFSFDVDFPNGPTSFAFDEKGVLYIADPVVRRLLVLDSEFETLNEIPNLPYNALIASKPIIRDNVFIETDGSQVITIDVLTGKILSQVFLDQSEYSGLIDKYNQNEFIFFKNITFNYLRDGRIVSLEDPGVSPDENNQRILSPDETLELIKTEYFNEIVLTESNNIIINGELQTRDFINFFNYWDDYYDGNREELTLTGKFYNEVSASQMRFIGKDEEGNWYWKFGSKVIVIYNARGQVIENFKYNSKMSKTLPAVHPSGDVYFMNYDEEGVYLYKVTRQW